MNQYSVPGHWQPTLVCLDIKNGANSLTPEASSHVTLFQPQVMIHTSRDSPIPAAHMHNAHTFESPFPLIYRDFRLALLLFHYSSVGEQILLALTEPNILHTCYTRTRCKYYVSLLMCQFCFVQDAHLKQTYLSCHWGAHYILMKGV